MRHLLSFSVYQDLGSLGENPWATLDSIGADGLELLTSYDAPDPCFRGLAETVHLPYATDWLAAWQGRPYDIPDDCCRYYMYGRDREEVVESITAALDAAASVSPAYGVLHAGNADIPHLYMRSQSRDSRQVLDAFADMVNTVVAGMPGSEPPFRILFENLWWPGLRLLDESDFRYLERKVDFDNWGICLDTGHMMNCLPRIDTERDGIDALRDIFLGYGRDLIDRISAVHFHWSASYGYRSTFEERIPQGDMMEFISSVYTHISSIDQHMPFSDPGCAELLDILEPDYVVHEMPGSKTGMLEDFRQQRGLLP